MFLNVPFASVYLMPWFFWVVKKRRLVFGYQCFGKAYPPQFQSSTSTFEKALILVCLSRGTENSRGLVLIYCCLEYSRKDMS